MLIPKRGVRYHTARRPGSYSRTVPEWSLEPSVSILPGLEGDASDGDSTDYSEAKEVKGRIIAGTGAIAPIEGVLDGVRPW